MTELFYLIACIALMVWLVRECFTVFAARPLSMVQLCVAVVLVLGIVVGCLHGTFLAFKP